MKLVACIMPSRNSPALVDRAIKSFEAQTYRNSRLVLGSQPSISVGALRNKLIAAAPDCPYIAHWDDDDVSAPDRLARSVEALEAGAELVGSSLCVYVDERPDKTQGQRWQYDGQPNQYLLGGTYVYLRELALRFPFPDTSTGEDTQWLRVLRKAGIRIHDLRDASLYTATIHGNNTCKKNPRPPCWTRLEDAPCGKP